MYYYEFEGGIFFSSDISYLLSLQEIKRKFSPEIYLLNSTVRMDAVSDLTWFKGINQLEPGSCLYIHKETNKIEIKRYWLPPDGYNIFSESKLLNYFTRSVKLRSNFTNKCVLLSGGVDSCAVASVLCNFDNKVQSYMFSFEGFSDEENHDLLYAKKFLGYCKQKGSTVNITINNLYDTLKEIVAILKRPLVHGCEIGMYNSYKSMAELGCKTIYTGQGADIMWGEQDSQYFPILSPSFRVDQHSEYYLKNCLYQNDTKDWYDFLVSNFYSHLSVQVPEINDMIWDKTFSSYRAYFTNDIFRKSRLHEMHRNVAYINHMNNSFSSFFGMKEIPAFQDINLANLSFQLPEYIKNKSNKYFLKPYLKNAFEPILPRFILERKKIGFPAPNINLWRKELVTIIKTQGTPFGINISVDEMQNYTFSQLLFLCTSKLWLEEFSL